jgi:hypothetical protein
MPMAFIFLGALVLCVQGLVVAVIAFVVPTLLHHELAPLAMQVFGVIGVVLMVFGWILDKFDH